MKLYLLCFSPQNNKKVEHYRVISTPNNKVTVDEEAFFPTLIELIKVYRNYYKKTEKELVTNCCKLDD